MPTILVVDDEKLLLESIVKSLSETGYSTYAAASGKAAMNIYENNNLDLILLDVKLPDIDGISILKRIRGKSPELPIIIMTAYSGIRGAVEAIKLGAYDYVAKPFDVEELLHVIKRCLDSQIAFAEIKKIWSVKKERYGFERILTNNSEMMNVIELCKRLANKTHSTVLILGESGTGKEVIANAIHYNDSGDRSKGPFVAVNCAALSGGVMESELFGHEKGAFTGATRQKKGLFEVADKGTIFLDEISEIDLKTQVKLLRFIEERTFQHVGGTRDIMVDVRIITATNRELIKEVKKRRFREDLYYRLNVISILLPPLRERKEDIDVLVKHFINIYSQLLNKEVIGCNDEALKLLINYNWPGNIRELRNIIERAVLLSEDERIKPSDLPYEISNNLEKTMMDSVKIYHQIALDKLIKLYTKNTLTKYHGNMTHAAKALNITRQRLKRILSCSYE